MSEAQKHAQEAVTPVPRKEKPEWRSGFCGKAKISQPVRVVLILGAVPKVYG
jgi:hypothetical protein